MHLRMLALFKLCQSGRHFFLVRASRLPNQAVLGRTLNGRRFFFVSASRLLNQAVLGRTLNGRRFFWFGRVASRTSRPGQDVKLSRLG